MRGDDLRNFVTLAKGISFIANGALADSNVVSWGAVCVESTGTTARVQAMLFDARLTLWAFIIDDAFWSAVRR